MAGGFSTRFATYDHNGNPIKEPPAALMQPVKSKAVAKRNDKGWNKPKKRRRKPSKTNARKYPIVRARNAGAISRELHTDARWAYRKTMSSFLANERVSDWIMEHFQVPPTLAHPLETIFLYSIVGDR